MKHQNAEKQTFDWDSARKEVLRSKEQITEAKINIISLKINYFQNWFDCDVLKKQLIKLLEKMEVQLQVAGKYIQFKGNEFKNKITQNIYQKYKIEPKEFFKALLCVSGTVLVACGLLLGLEYAAVISLLSVATKKILKKTFMVSTIGVSICVLDFLFSLYKGNENSQKFKTAIKAAQKGLRQIQEMIKNLN